MDRKESRPWHGRRWMDRVKQRPTLTQIATVSPGVHQAIAALPGLSQPVPHLALFLFCHLAGIRYERCRLRLRQLQKPTVAYQVGHEKVRDPRLSRAKKLSWPAQLQVKLGQLESVLRAHHGCQALHRLGRDLAAGHEDAVGLGASAP